MCGLPLCEVWSERDISSKCTIAGIAIYGTAALFGMLAHLPVVSMFGILAQQHFGIESFHVGFLFALAAAANVATNACVAPRLLRFWGDIQAGALGSFTVVLGALALMNDLLAVSVCGLVTVYIGVAVSSSSVACGSAKLTDQRNRSTLMTGVRMLKNTGAIMSPVIAGAVASTHVQLLFLVTAVAALVAGTTQLLTMRWNLHLQELSGNKGTMTMLEGDDSNNDKDDNHKTVVPI